MFYDYLLVIFAISKQIHQTSTNSESMKTISTKRSLKLTQTNNYSFMNPLNPHLFHIPVMGIGFTIDSPIKVAAYGIDSVISIVDDIIIEQMREFYSNSLNLEFLPISKKDDDFRARRITDYLNLVLKIVQDKFQKLKKEEFREGAEICKYFEYLPESSPLKTLYEAMLAEENQEVKKQIQQDLRSQLVCGSINVNIMAKVDTVNYDSKGNELPEMYNDAMAALRGYANSDLNSSIILSAGLNPRLYSYFEEFKDFFPDEKGEVKKNVILKVSDYRSALIQGKMLAKKGLWISEYRIESGLNCGGHTFATDGKLMGPILEEFKENKENLIDELYSICQASLARKESKLYNEIPPMKITVQGGIGTSNESKFLLENYKVDSAGWGSPFLLVPEATNVDEDTLKRLATAKKEDYYVSDASPLGVPFNNLKNTSSQRLLKERIQKDRPGSPCHKKFLTFNTEFTEQSICTASRQYQNLKLKELKQTTTSAEEFEEKSRIVLEKECLCEGLAIPAALVNDVAKAKQLKAVSVCPGPNLAYFSGTFSLKEMIDHIYGRSVILNSLNREHMFINELEMYVDHLKKEINTVVDELTVKQTKYFDGFKTSLLEGVNYYKETFKKMKLETEEYRQRAETSLEFWEEKIAQIRIPQVELV